jgi:hypothetical protein
MKQYKIPQQLVLDFNNPEYIVSIELPDIIIQNVKLFKQDKEYYIQLKWNINTENIKNIKWKQN